MPNPTYSRASLITVRQVLDTADTGAGDDGGVAVALADAPGSTEREAVGEGPDSSVGPAEAVPADDAADGATAVDAGPVAPGVCVSAGVAPPQAAATSRNVAKMPANLVPARESTVRRDRIKRL
jgi:hypothetical protein